MGQDRGNYFSGGAAGADLLLQYHHERIPPGGCDAAGDAGHDQRKIRASGTITANETYNVKLAQSRKIESVKCKVGQAVNAGDVLFVLEAQESDELKAAKTDLEAKELDYQKSLINASNDSAQEDRDVQKLRDAYNEALTIYNQYSSMDPRQISLKREERKRSPQRDHNKSAHRRN